MATGSRLSVEIRGTNQAIHNALDGQALIDNAKGGRKEIVNILYRMREIALQALNGTINLNNIASLQTEIDHY